VEKKQTKKIFRSAQNAKLRQIVLENVKSQIGKVVVIRLDINIHVLPTNVLEMI